MQVVFLIVIIELFLFLTAVCLLSKASLLLLFLFFLMEAFRLDFLKRKKWKGVVLIAGVLFLFSLVLFLVPDIRQSFSQALYTWQHPEQINPNSASESSEMRMMTWKTAWNIFLQQPLTGTGTGDVNPELWKSFAEQGFLMPAEKHLNAHNQFLQTSAALGLPGLISLLLLPCYALLQGWREKNGHWLALGIMLLWLPMTECWFEQQQAMFFLLFWWVYLCGNNAESSQT
jgi:O-antigen ligase